MKINNKFNKIFLAIFLFLFIGIVGVNATLQDGLVAFYNPESTNNWNDLSGNNNDGTSFNQGSNKTLFDGNNDYVDLGFKPNINTFTISVIAETKVETNQGIISTITNSGTDRKGFNIAFLNGKINSIVYNSGGGINLENGNLQTNRKYNIILTYSNGLSKLYVDGNFITSSTSTITSFFTNLRAGRYYSELEALTLNGNIYNIAVYNRQLSQTEVTELNNKNGNPLPEPEPPELITTLEQSFTQKQESTLTINNTNWNTILQGNFTLNKTNTTVYDEIMVAVSSETDNMTIECRQSLDNITSNETVKKTLDNGESAILNLLTDGINLTSGEHNIKLECKNNINGTSIIGFGRGIGHIMRTSDNRSINYKHSEANVTINSGETFGVIAGNSFTTRTNESSHKYVVVDWSTQITNNLNQQQLIKIFAKINNLNNLIECTQNRITIKPGERKSVGGVCFLEVEPDLFNQISIQATGINVNYKTDIAIKEFDYNTANEIKRNVVSDIVIQTLTYQEVANTVFEANTDNANVIVKGFINTFSGDPDLLQGKIEVLDETDNVIYETSNLGFINGPGWDSISFQTSVPIKNGINKFKLYLKSNNLSVIHFIDKIEINGYVTNKLDFVDNSFNVKAFEFWDNTQLNNFSAIIGGVTYSTTGNNVTVIGANPFEDIIISKSGYLSRLYEQHDTTQDLNASIGQNQLNIRSSEKYTDNNINNFSLETDIGTFSTTNGLITIYPFEAIYYDWNITTDSYYNKTGLEFQVGGSLTEYEIENFTDTILNFKNEDNDFIFPTCTYNENITITTPYDLAVQKTDFNNIICKLDNYNVLNYNLSNNISLLPQNLTFTMPFTELNISLYDVSTNELIQNQNFTVQIIGEEFSNEYFLNNTANITIVDPLIQKGTYTLIVNNINYETVSRRFNYDNQESLVLDMYLTAKDVPEETVADLIVRTVNKYSNSVKKVPVIQYIWDSTKDKYIEINEKTTDENNGETSFKVFLNTRLYNFCAKFDGKLFCEDDVIVNINTQVLSIEIDTETIEPFNESGIFKIDFVHSLTKTPPITSPNEQFTVTFSYSDPNQEIKEFCLETYKRIDEKVELLYEDCSTDSTGGISRNFIQNETEQFIVKSVIYKGIDRRVLDTLNLNPKFPLEEQTKDNGLYKAIAFVLLIGAISIGLSPKVENIMLVHILIILASIIVKLAFPSFLSVESLIVIILFNIVAIGLTSKRENIGNILKVNTITSIILIYLLFIFSLVTVVNELDNKNMLDGYGESIKDKLITERNLLDNMIEEQTEQMKKSQEDAKKGLTQDTLNLLFSKALNFVDNFFGILSTVFQIPTTLLTLLDIDNLFLNKLFVLFDYALNILIIRIYYKEAFK